MSASAQPAAWICPGPKTNVGSEDCRLLLDEPGVLRIFLEEEEGLQIHEWFDYNPEGRDPLVLQLLDRIYELLLEHPVEKVLVKADRTRGAFSPVVQTFLREIQFPRLLNDTSLRYVATIKSADQMTAMGAELWKVQLEQNSRLIMRDVESEDDGREWLDQLAELARQKTS